MGLLAKYELVFEHLPLVEVAAAVPGATLTVDVGQPNQAGPPPFFLTASGADEAAVENALDRAEFVQRYTPIKESEGRRYRVVPAATMDEQLGPHVDREGLAELADIDSILEGATVTPDGWRQRRWFADREAFERYCSFWRTNAERFALERLRAADGFGTTPADGLTDRQLEALTAADRMGYFEVPRRASLGAVADELGISASSLSERLRRAQAHLVDAALADARRDMPPFEGPQG